MSKYNCRGTIKARFYYSGTKLLRAEINSTDVPNLDEENLDEQNPIIYLPILDDRGTLVGVAEGQCPIC